jgi:hypothetical protein
VDSVRFAPHRTGRLRLLSHVILLAGILFVPSRAAAAQEDRRLEYQVKAAYLFNFIKFVEWPPSAFHDAHDPVSICVLGDDPFGPALDLLVHGETVNSHRVSVQRLRDESVKSCHVLFIAGMEKEIPAILARLEPGVLTVGEGDRFLREGGVISFVIENRRVRFDINQSAAAKAALTISSKLLKVARSVEK